jgi:hypothetical protein
MCQRYVRYGFRFRLVRSKTFLPKAHRLEATARALDAAATKAEEMAAALAAKIFN